MGAPSISVDACYFIKKQSQRSLKNSDSGDFLGGPVVKSLCFNAGGTGLIPSWGTRSYILHDVTKQLKKKRAENTQFLESGCLCFKILFLPFTNCVI